MNVFLIVFVVVFLLLPTIWLSCPRFLILRLLTIKFESNIIIIQSLLKLPQLIQTSPTSKIRINMSIIQFYNNGKILNSILDLVKFLMSTTDKIISIDIPIINIK